MTAGSVAAEHVEKIRSGLETLRLMSIIASSERPSDRARSEEAEMLRRLDALVALVNEKEQELNERIALSREQLERATSQRRTAEARVAALEQALRKITGDEDHGDLLPHEIARSVLAVGQEDRP